MDCLKGQSLWRRTALLYAMEYEVVGLYFCQAGPRPNEQDCNTTLPHATIDVLQSRQWLCKPVAASTKGAVTFNYTALQSGELPQIVVDEKHNKQLVPDKVIASFRYALTNLEQPMTLESRPPDILNQLNTTEEELQNVMTRIFHDAPNTSLDDLLNTDLFLDLTQTYYQRLGSQIMRFAYSVDDDTVVEGSAIRNEARLVVQTVPVRTLDGVLAACILLVSYILFRLRKSTALPCDPYRLGGLLLILRRQPQARRIFLRTGYFGIDQLYAKVNPSTDGTSTQPNDARSLNERTVATDDPNHSTQAEGREVRKIDHKVLVREWWRPLTITIPVRASMFLLTIVVIIALQILLSFSKRNRGLLTVPVDGHTHLAWSIVPAFAMVSIGIYFRALGSCYKVFSPYCRLRRDDNMGPMLVNYQTSTEIEVLASAAKGRQYAVMFLATASLVSAFLTIIMSGVWSAQPVPSTRQVPLTPETWFSQNLPVDEGEVGNNAYLSGLILATNASFPSWTHEAFTLASAAVKGDFSDATKTGQRLQGDLPAIRASLNCTFYNQTNIPDLKFLGIAGTNGSIGGPLSYSVRLRLPGPSSCSGDAYHYIRPGDDDNVIGWFDYFTNDAQGCPSLTYVWGRWDTSGDVVTGSRDVDYAKSLSCYESIEQIQLDTTLSYRGLEIDTQTKPRVVKVGFQRTFSAQTLGLPYDNLVTVGHSSLSPFASAMLQYNGISVLGISNPELSDSIAEAIKLTHGIIRAQQFNAALRRNVEEQTDDLPPLTAVLTDPARSRLVQNAVSTHVLCALLGTMVVCAALSSWLMSTNYVLPKNPSSIAAMVSLLADSNILEDERLLAELEREIGGRRGRGSTYADSRKFRLGWFDDPDHQGKVYTINRL